MAMATCTKCNKMGFLSELWPPVCEKCKPSKIGVVSGIDTSRFQKDDSLYLIDGELTAHHECGPSSLFRRQECPGSMIAERGLKSIDSEASTEGHIMHQAVWIEVDRENLSIDQLKLLQMADAALEKIAAKYGVTEWHGETRVQLSLGRWGTIDAWGYAADGSVVIVDLKFGFKEVSSPSANLQLADYACGILNCFEMTQKKVTACIIQPRIMGSNFKEYTFTEFRNIETHIKAIINRCYDKDAPRCAGTHCEYCKAFQHGTCNEVDKMTNELANFETTAITADNADDLYEKACLVEKKIKAIKAQCKQVTIDNGGRAGRLEIRTKNGNRFIPDLQKAYESVQDIMTVQEFLACCSANISQLEKEVADRLKRLNFVPTLIAGKDKFNEIMGVKNKPSTQEIKLNK